MEPAPAPPGDDDGLTCPWCGAIDVEQIAAYGSLLMTAQWFCNACGSPFERVRHRSALEGDAHDGAPDDGDSAPGDDGRVDHGR
jgi:hypothetical protein